MDVIQMELFPHVADREEAEWLAREQAIKNKRRRRVNGSHDGASENGDSNGNGKSQPLHTMDIVAANKEIRRLKEANTALRDDKEELCELLAAAETALRMIADGRRDLNAPGPAHWGYYRLSVEHAERYFADYGRQLKLPGVQIDTREGVPACEVRMPIVEE